MFGRKTKVATIESVKPVKPSLSIEKLDELLERREFPRFGNYKLPWRQWNALVCLEAEEKIGERINVNNAWYEYELPIHEADYGSILERPKSSLTYSIYGFPLPMKISNKLAEFIECVHTPNSGKDPGNDWFSWRKVCLASVVSASPQLGYIEEQRRQPIVADPILLIRIWFRGKEYTYSLGQWDLIIDLNRVGEG
jgi:hypothetical protein